VRHGHRERLAISADARFTFGRVFALPEKWADLRVGPRGEENGPESSGKMLHLWTYLNKLVADFSRPGKHADIAFIETFNGRIRHEWLDLISSCAWKS
jgi:putative transposase